MSGGKLSIPEIKLNKLV